MVYRYTPFDGLCKRDVIENVRKGLITFPQFYLSLLKNNLLRGDKYKNISKEFKEFTKKLLAYNPDQRYSAQEAL